MRAVTPVRRPRSGFILLEAILALALFGAISVSLTAAIQKVGSTAVYASERMRVQRVLETLLTEATKVAELEPGIVSLGPRKLNESTEVFYSREIEEIEILNMDGQPLQNTYRVAVVAEWEDMAGRDYLQVAEVIRYEPLYRNTR